MRPDASFIGQPVRSLQQMLRVLSEKDGTLPIVIPDGIYSTQTAAAVSQFQQNHGLPVTGVADQDTWEIIVAEYEPAIVQISEAQPVEIILNPNEVLRYGDQSPYLYVAQAILTVLSQTYSSVAAPSQSGVLDEATADSIASFQSLGGLPASGELDKLTWKLLALHFPLSANLGKGKSQSETIRHKI